MTDAPVTRFYSPGGFSSMQGETRCVVCSQPLSISINGSLYDDGVPYHMNCYHRARKERELVALLDRVNDTLERVNEALGSKE